MTDDSQDWDAGPLGDGGGNLHVYPLDDLVGHELNPGCVCMPRVEPVQAVDGAVSWVFIHASLDGRERRE